MRVLGFVPRWIEGLAPGGLLGIVDHAAATGADPPVPDQLVGIDGLPESYDMLDADLESLESYVANTMAAS